MHRMINQFLLVSAMMLQPILGSVIVKPKYVYGGKILDTAKKMRRAKRKFGFK